MRKGLSKSQVICIALLWVALCIMLFTMSTSSIGEKILISVVSGVIIYVGISKGNDKAFRRRRRFRNGRGLEE